MTHVDTRDGVRIPAAEAVSVPVRRSSIQEQMHVYGFDGEWVGQVREVQTAAFLVDRPGRRDLVVPLDLALIVVDGHITLTLPSDRLNSLAETTRLPAWLGGGQ